MWALVQRAALAVVDVAAGFGAVIHLGGWMRIDPRLSRFVSPLLLKSTGAILAESSHFLMEGVPHQIDYLAVGAGLATLPGVVSVYELHVRDMSPAQAALTGHLDIDDLSTWAQVLAADQVMPLAPHGIDHVTRQAELARTPHWLKRAGAARGPSAPRTKRSARRS